MRAAFYSKAKNLFIFHLIFFVIVVYGTVNTKSNKDVEFTFTLTKCSDDGSMQIVRNETGWNKAWAGILNLLKILSVRLPVSQYIEVFYTIPMKHKYFEWVSHEKEV